MSPTWRSGQLGKRGKPPLTQQPTKADRQPPAGLSPQPSQRVFCPSCLAPAADEQAVCQACAYGRPELGWPQDAYLGRTIAGKYEVLERLGGGGFGVVVRARHRQGGHDLGEVVLKFMRSDLADSSADRQRFINEARAARALHSPHVVKVFDLDFDEQGVPFMVMEYLEGATLAEQLRDGPLPLTRALRLGVQIAGAMAECHSLGVVHRDLKPSNLLLLPVPEGDFIKIIDFGNARLGEGSGTRTLIGTPRYMAPEQILRGELDGRADIFGLGVILYECLCGEPPIAAEDELAYLEHNLNQAPRPLRELAPSLPEVLGGLLARMMAKDRDARPAAMGEVQQRLQAIATDPGASSARVAPQPTRPLATTTTAPDDISLITAPKRRVRRSGLLVSLLLAAAAVGGFARWLWPTQQHALVGTTTRPVTRQLLDAGRDPRAAQGTPDTRSSTPAQAKRAAPPIAPPTKHQHRAAAQPLRPALATQKARVQAPPKKARAPTKRAASKATKPSALKGWGPDPVDDL